MFYTSRSNVDHVERTRRVTMLAGVIVGLFIGSSVALRVKAAEYNSFDADAFYGKVTCDTVVCKCPDDGRLKGVKVGSERYKKTVAAFPNHSCILIGPTG